MKYIVFLFAFVVICQSVPLGGRSISIDNDTGSIIIQGADGKRVVITRPVDLSGQKNIEISVSGPNIPTKRIQITDRNVLTNGQGGQDINLLDDVTGRYVSRDNSLNEKFDDEYLRSKRGSKSREGKFTKTSQVDILGEILKEYQGAVDEVSYQKLLKKIQKSVQAGELSPSIFDVLQSLNQRQVVDSQAQTGQLIGDDLTRTGVRGDPSLLQQGQMESQGVPVEGRGVQWGIPLSRVGIMNQQPILGQQGLNRVFLDRQPIIPYSGENQMLLDRSQLYPSIWSRMGIRQVVGGQRYGLEQPLQGVYTGGRVGLQQFQQVPLSEETTLGRSDMGGILSGFGRQASLQQRGILGQTSGLQGGIQGVMVPAQMQREFLGQSQPLERGIFLNRVNPYEYGYNSIGGNLEDRLMQQQMMGVGTRGVLYGANEGYPIMVDEGIPLSGRYNSWSPRIPVV